MRCVPLLVGPPKKDDGGGVRRRLFITRVGCLSVSFALLIDTNLLGVTAGWLAAEDRAQLERSGRLVLYDD